MPKRYWLMKCEPGAYTIDDLARDGRTSWEGVRNYQARNFMRDLMQEGDGVLFYASNADPSGVTGLATIAKAGYPDHFAWKQGHKYFDTAGAASFVNACCWGPVRNPMAGWLRAFCQAAIISRERGPKMPSLPRVSKPSEVNAIWRR